MALFKKEKKNTEKVEKKEVAEKKEITSKKTATATETKTDLSWVVIKPKITEKAAVIAGASNCYTFWVHNDATKPKIKDAIKSIYKVTPKKIAVSSVKSKKIRRKGIPGVKAGGKKAYVFLKKGDKIEFV